MEEDRDLSAQAEEENQDIPAPREPEQEPVEGADVAPEGENTPSETPTPAREPAWDFGKEPAPKRGGTGKFFAVFGGIFALCVCLLVAALFLGDRGLRITRTLHTERTIYVREDDGTSGLLTPSEAADLVRRSTVTIVVKTAAGKGIGSGFVYDGAGHICTNYHVIEDAERIQVVLPDGKAVDAAVVGYNAVADLAVLHIDAEGLVPVRLGSSTDLLVGDAVVAIGTPYDLELAGTATFGNVSATNRLLPLADGAGTVYRKITVIQTDASVNPGNSGGPMANMYGEVIGIVVRKVVGNGAVSYEGLGFALPIDGAKVILDAIIQDGAFHGVNPLAEGRSLLGVTGYGVQAGRWYRVDPATNNVDASDEAQAGYTYAAANGVYIDAVTGAGVATVLRTGDIITAVDGLEMNTITDVIGAVNRHYAGEIVTLTLYRDGDTVTVQIVLSEGTVS